MSRRWGMTIQANVPWMRESSHNPLKADKNDHEDKTHAVRCPCSTPLSLSCIHRQIKMLHLAPLPCPPHTRSQFNRLYWHGKLNHLHCQSTHGWANSNNSSGDYDIYIDSNNNNHKYKLCLTVELDIYPRFSKHNISKSFWHPVLSDSCSVSYRFYKFRS
jgi:hypothetical protein